MNVWRLIPHHEYPVDLVEWSRDNGTIAIGWGQMGNLNRLAFHTEDELKGIVKDRHMGYSSGSCANGGRSLWRLHHEMRKGDLVIISASGSRRLTMRVTGDYYFKADDPTHSYEHRRKAEVVPINPDRLWHAAGRAGPGEGVYGTLVRCARTLTEAQANALTE